jgi:hypothetical protein
VIAHAPGKLAIALDKIARNRLARAATDVEDRGLQRQHAKETVEPGDLEQRLAACLVIGTGVALVEPDDLVGR